MEDVQVEGGGREQSPATAVAAAVAATAPGLSVAAQPEPQPQPQHQPDAAAAAAAPRAAAAPSPTPSTSTTPAATTTAPSKPPTPAWIYWGPILPQGEDAAPKGTDADGNVAEMPADIARKVKALMEEVREKGSEPATLLRGITVKVSRRATGQLDASYFFPEDGGAAGPASKRLRSTREVLRHLGLVEEEEEDVFESAPPTSSAASASAAAPTSSKRTLPVNRLVNENKELKQDHLCAGGRTTTMRIGALDEHSLSGKASWGVFPTGYLAHTVFSSPLTPAREALYECTCLLYTSDAADD